uniref:Death domain-associated protein 6 n=1 Tax=Leptobrachium leishanense TaxID=445787 RepID=A0A8C5WGE8_9ANUR
MAHANDIIVLDDDDDDEEEEKPHCSNATSSPQPPEPATNGKKESSSKSKSATFSILNNKLFDEFVDYCSNLTVEHPEVIGFLKGRFSKANPTFLSSVEFHNVLGRCLTKVQSKRSKVYVYINELCTALKANSQKRKVTLQTCTIPKPPQEEGEKVEEKTEDVQEEDSSPGKKTGSKRQIRYLENLLRIYSREIQKLQEKELSLDELEDEDSAYIQEARLKRKILRIFQKLCELKDCSSLTGRVIEQKIPYRGTRYPEVNRRLEKFINGSHDIFPDYNDVLRVILKANDKHALGLPRKQMQGMAQDAFRELGNRLQERRHLDLVYNFGCHLTDVYKPGNDPAHQDSALQRRLRDNRSVSLNRLEDLIKKYAEMQDEGEEEDRKKRRKNDTQSSSKVSSKPTPPPSPGSEEEESSEESETDIEDLVNSEEIADGEGKEEEEEEQPVEQENEADQRMEIPSDPQPFSSTGEDEEEGEETDDKNEEADYEMEEGEQVDQSTTPASSPQTNKEESHLSSLELEIEVLPLDRSPCSPGKATSPHSSMDRPSEELKEVSSVESKSEHDATRDDTESQELKVCENAAENEEENAENMLENMHDEDHEKSDVEDRDISSTVNNDVNITADVLQVETDLQADGESCASGNVETEEVSEVKSNFNDAEDDQLNKCTGNASTSFIKRTTPVDGEKVLTQSCQVDADIQCIESPQDSTERRDKIASCRESNLQSKNSALKKKTASTNSELQHNKSHTKVSSPAGYNALYIDSYAGNDVHGVPEGSHVGSSNGVYRVKREGKPLQGSPFRSNHKNFIRDSPKSKRTNDIVMLSSKIKKSPSSQIMVKNGKRLLNGSGQGEGKIEKPPKKQRTERYYASPLPNKPDKNKDRTPDITLAMVVTCSPPVSPSSTGTQPLMSHVSTQCDPDEVIVLSD